MANAARKAEVVVGPDMAYYGPFIDQARDELLACVRKRENSACSFVGPKGGIDTVSGSVCHSFMHGHSSKFVINSLQTGEAYGENPGRILPKETELWFVEYILNRSPYADTFITKDPVRALERGFTISSGDHPGNLVGAGVVALRRLWEHVYVAQSAYDLHKAGVPEDLAFLIGHAIQVESKIKPDSVTSWSNNLNWHTSVDIGLMSFKFVKNFFEHKLVTPNDHYVNGGRYNGYSNMYGYSYEGNLSSYITGNFPYHLYKGDKAPVAVVGTNPFIAAKKALEKAEPKVRNEHTAPYAKAIEVMAEWAKTHLMEKINRA